MNTLLFSCTFDICIGDTHLSHTPANFTLTVKNRCTDTAVTIANCRMGASLKGQFTQITKRHIFSHTCRSSNADLSGLMSPGFEMCDAT